MMNKNDDSVQEVQELLGKTHTGRTIQDAAIPAVRAWKSNVGTDYGKSECKLCGMILKSNYFVQGCLNCGSTDVAPVSA
jgi:hypothetical protein